jgi:MFS family permease
VLTDDVVGILNNPNFAEQFNHPGPTLVGQIVSTYDIGCIIGALISIYFGDKLGRRWSVAMSCMWVIVGGLLQATAFNIPHMIVGRVIAGLGIGQSTAVVRIAIQSPLGCCGSRFANV